jgi:hypothetical protein
VPGKYRKEIELSARKTQIGILPTRNSALEIASDLRSQMMGWGAKSPVSAPGEVFANATHA